MPRRSAVLPRLLAAGALAAVARSRLFLAGSRPSVAVRGAGLVARRGIMDQPLKDLLNDPSKAEEMKKAMEELQKDPEKMKALEDYSKTMQSAVEKMKDDPEMKEFFEDVQKNGLEALSKYEKDERILRKFSQATGGVPGMPPMPGMGGAAPGPAFKPGDEVFIRGLSKAPELNGKKAMVVPPTAEERESLAGTDRLIVRLVDSGDQFAVKPANLRTAEQEASDAIGGDLEDVSLYNPALQSEAAKLRETGKLDALQEDPELKPIFEDIKKNGMAALEKYWSDEKLMAKISKAMAAGM